MQIVYLISKNIHQRASGGVALLVLIAALAGLTTLSTLVWASPANEQGAFLAPDAPEAVPSIDRPGIYVFQDYSNVDPNENPITGGHATFEWQQVEMGRGQYDWDDVDRWLAKESASNKPTAIGFASYNARCCGGDAMPPYLADEHPDMQVVCEDAWIIPKYWSESYLQEWGRFIGETGRRYDNDPRVAFVEIGVGIFGETKPSDTVHRDCLEDAGLSSELWVQTVKRIIDDHKRAFPTTPLVLQYAPFFESPTERRHLTDYAASQGIGIKHNGLRPDADAVNIDNPNYSLFGSGQYDPMYKWWQDVAIGWESYEALYMTGLTNTTWGVYNGLDKHADYIVLARDLVIQTERHPILSFAQEHLGKTIETSPSAWVAFRETEYDWYPQFGNYEFFLVQNDEVQGGRTTPLWNISAYAEGRYTRRTDSASGNPYMYFDVEDGYLHDTREQVRLNITYFDSGNDQFDVYYDAWDSPQKLAGTVRKTNTGRWLKASWELNDARFGNRQPGGGDRIGSDISLYARGDGDETIHLVQVERLGIAPTPTPSPTPRPVTYPTPTWTPEPYGFRQKSDVSAGRVRLHGSGRYLRQCMVSDKNYGSTQLLLVRHEDAHSTLIRFDGVGLPSGAKLGARLCTTCMSQDRSNDARMYVRSFDMNTAWEANTATWHQARNGVLWSEPGIGSGDYAENYTDFQFIYDIDRWVELDVTDSAKRWLSNPSSNRGILLDAYGTASVRLRIPII